MHDFKHVTVVVNRDCQAVPLACKSALALAISASCSCSTAAVMLLRASSSVYSLLTALHGCAHPVLQVAEAVMAAIEDIGQFHIIGR
jgi:hypothetical protein